MAKKNSNELTERVKIQEKALSNLADSLKKREDAFDEEMGDVLGELKAIKLFLARNIPEFKKQFQEIRRKIK